MQVLIVDDDERLLGLLDRWITAAGYDVVTCTRFEDARRYLATNAPAILLAEVRLGAFNGLQLVLVAKGANPAVGAIVLSGYDDPVLRREAKVQGAFYLLKPITREQLFECLSTLAPAVPTTS